ncbi:MAG: glutamine synthetase family protein [candidate division WOR-3 bacterium]
MEEILRTVKDRKIEAVRFWLTDVLGRLKGFNITTGELERGLSEGIMFDGSSVEGFVRIEESDLIAFPDPKTFKILPEGVGNIPTAILICDIRYPDGRPFESDPRGVLKRNLQKANDLGYEYYVGPELEFFYFPNEKDPTPVDKGGYFDIMPLNKASAARKDAVLALMEMGFRVEASHHEVAHSQHEIDFKYSDALYMADLLQVAKVIIKEKAMAHGLFASFMPKPVFGINGSGMHVHQSLFREGENAFYSDSKPYNLSDVAKGFIAGLLRHAREITAITNQWVNSYKRLVVGYEAPVYICWGRKNRSALVRVPGFKEGKSSSCRAEYRAPDPACNPYLAFSVMLAAGLAGIEKNYPLPEPVEEDIYRLPEEAKREYGIDALPDSLYSATEVMEKSEVVREALGPELFAKYVANKREEWERYRIQVTDYEIREYLPNL